MKLKVGDGSEVGSKFDEEDKDKMRSKLNRDNGGGIGSGLNVEDPDGCTENARGEASGTTGPIAERVSEEDRLGSKRKIEEGVGEADEGKRARNREGRQGTKRKVDEEDDEEGKIRRMIEEEVDKVNHPAWIRGEPNKARHIGEV